MIMPYSQMKIKEKKEPPYSILKPDTSSLSPSEKSKGARPTSDKHRKTHPTKKWAKKKQNQRPT